MSFRCEILSERIRDSEYVVREQLFDCLMSWSKRQSNPTQSSRIFRRYNPEIPDAKTLATAYWETCKILDRKWPDASARTPSEKMIARRFIESTKLHFFRSIWIGPRNIDLFFPQIRGSRDDVRAKGACSKKSFKGLAIEVNGEVHKKTLKLLKDFRKQEKLFQSGIALFVTENEDISKLPVYYFINQIKNLPRLDSRGRNRVMRKIHRKTILFYGNNQMLSELFCCDFNGLMSDFKKIKTNNQKFYVGV